MNLFIQKKAVRKVKDITTDKLLVAGIAKPQSFLDIYRLQMMYVWFSDHHHFKKRHFRH
jgi:tetraacyldisaccharide-1-P 4'-kinase